MYGFFLNLAALSPINSSMRNKIAEKASFDLLFSEMSIGLFKISLTKPIHLTNISILNLADEILQGKSFFISSHRIF